MGTCATRRPAALARRISLQHRHVVLFGTVLGVLLIALGLLPSDEVEAKRIALPLDGVRGSPGKATSGMENPTAALEPAVAMVPDADSAWQQIKVRGGDNLSLVFARFGLSPRDVHAIMNSKGGSKELKRLYPGQTLAVQTDTGGDLESLRLQVNRLHQINYLRGEQGFERSEVHRTPDKRTVYRHARLENSLFLAGARAGLSDELIMELANIFSGVIDFVLDPRRGDTFGLVYEELWLDDERIGTGNILAAEYINDGKSFAAYHYVDRDGKSGYFDPQGVSMQKAFLRAPLDFTRISSNFSLRRKHPVHKRVRAHRGVDYAAPTGTPVFAAGAGRVVAAGYSRANGNYVFLQHGEKYTTKYLHLSKRKVRKGQKVGQKQVIGLVGATGLATGPHLHYEFIVNGVHRNPRTIIDQLPRARAIASAERRQFHDAIGPYQQQLASYREAWQLAQAGN